jgi:hypothetical protein
VDAPRADPTRCEPAVALAAREIRGGALFEAEIGSASVHSTALATARVARCAAQREWYRRSPTKLVRSRARRWRSIPEFAGLEPHPTDGHP